MLIKQKEIVKFRDAMEFGIIIIIKLWWFSIIRIILSNTELTKKSW